MTPVFGFEQSIVPWVALVAGIRPDFGNCRTMAVFNGNGDLVAGVVFHNWSPESAVIELTAASIDRRWATRGVMNAVFGYVFDFAQAAVARTAEDNMTVRKLWKALGASEYIIPRLRGRTASDAVLVLTDDAWAVSKYRRKGA